MNEEVTEPMSSLRERFTDLAQEHGGWYDEPGDPRPPQA